jgi:hypothetical protein
MASKIKDEDQKARMGVLYLKMRNLSVSSFCSLLRKHPHFNFRINILNSVMPKLSHKDVAVRKEVTKLVFDLLAKEDQGLLDFKVDVLRELNKVIKTRPHEHMEANLLDCLVLHLIIVDE